MTLTKREILKAICETPGWSPPARGTLDALADIDRSLHALLAEGWIVSRIDGWEATANALEAYPHFKLDEQGRVVAAPPGDEQSADREAPTVPLERVEALLAVILSDLPVRAVYARVDAVLTLSLEELQAGPEWGIAAKLAAELAT
jgi:hypothetical protein